MYAVIKNLMNGDNKGKRIALGLTHYYMGPRDKREVTATERSEALATIPDLPAGWMQEWMLHKTPQKRSA